MKRLLTVVAMVLVLGTMGYIAADFKGLINKTPAEKVGDMSTDYIATYTLGRTDDYHTAVEFYNEGIHEKLSDEELEEMYRLIMILNQVEDLSTRPGQEVMIPVFTDYRTDK